MAVGHKIFEITGELKESEVLIRKKLFLFVLCAVLHIKMMESNVFAFLSGLQYLGRWVIRSLISWWGRSINRVPCHSGFSSWMISRKVSKKMTMSSASE